MQNEPYVIAEIGCNHGGSLERAKMLIRLAKDSKANAVKFQKRDVDLSTPEHMKNKPHPNSMFAFGNTYLEHRKNLELSQTQHAILKQFCEDLGITYSTSVWDLPSAEQIVSLEPEFIKIPSACNHRFDIADWLLKNSKADIHLSLGMTDEKERKDILKHFLKYSGRVVLYHCTSAYPCPFEKLYLKEVLAISSKEHYRIGFSNHGYGIAADIAALAYGATYFERHFVDDRLYPHTDAAASLEPSGLEKLCRDLHNVSKALRFKPDGIDSMELEQRKKLRID